MKTLGVDFSSLTISERLQLIDALWLSLARELQAVSLPPEELHRKLAALEAGEIGLCELWDAMHQ